MKNINAIEKRLLSRSFTKRLNWRGNGWRQNLRSAGDIINSALDKFNMRPEHEGETKVDALDRFLRKAFAVE